MEILAVQGPIPLKGAETKVQHLSGHHKAVHMAS